MSCPEIKSLTFSADGENMIRAIVAKQKLGNLLAGIISTSKIIEIFSGGGPFGMVLNITKSDWVAWAEGMSSVGKITRDAVMLEAATMALKTSGKENEFWVAVHYGCK